MSTHGYQQPGHPPAHIDALQSLRGIFAVFIFFHHLDVFPAGGDVGVVFFLMLSGFVMTYGYGAHGGGPGPQHCAAAELGAPPRLLLLGQLRVVVPVRFDVLLHPLSVAEAPVSQA